MFINFIIFSMLVYEVCKLVSPQWEVTQRNTMVKLAKHKAMFGSVDAKEHLTPDLCRYIAAQLLYELGELILFLTFKPKYMLAVVAIKAMSKIVSANGNRTMDDNIIRTDSMVTIAILLLTMTI